MSVGFALTMTNVKATVNWLIIVQSLADLMPAANFATQQMEKKTDCGSRTITEKLSGNLAQFV